jgi:putative transposase
MGKLCELFGKTRQGWYDAVKRVDEEQVWDMILYKQILDIRENQPNAGLRKLNQMLVPFCENWGIKMGRDKLGDFMRENCLFIRKKAYKVQTTHSFHRFHKYPNKTKDLILTRRNQLWVTDITYLRLKDKKGEFAYLTLITDAYSRKIVGWCLFKSLSTQGCLNALNQALNTLTKTDTAGLIHHSDRGIQYCSDAYTARLRGFKYGEIQISMTENGDPYENALAERMNRTIKEEMLNNRIFPTFGQAKQAIDKAIKEYNEVRPHQSINFLTPQKAHNMTGDIPKRWKRYPYKPKDVCSEIIPLAAPQAQAVG